MKYLLTAASLALMTSVASAQTLDDKVTEQIVKKEKEKTTATVFIRRGDMKKKIVKRKTRHNANKRKSVPRKAYRPKPGQMTEAERMNSGTEMEMGMGMEQMPSEIQEGM